MDLEERLAKLKKEILAIKRELDSQGEVLENRSGADMSSTISVSCKLDELISEYLRTKEKIELLKGQKKL